MIELTEKDIVFSNRSLLDPSGKVFFYQNRVFRAIYDQKFATLYTELLKEDWFNSLFQQGLIKTWICQDISLSNVPLILEHEKVSFVTVPCEWTAQMFYFAAKMMVRLNLELSRHGLLLQDSHPWNILYHRGYSVFIDFGSIIQAKKVSSAWLSEFIRCIGVPLWLGTTRWHDLAAEYKKEHTSGFGIALFQKRLSHKLFLRGLTRLRKFLYTPSVFFEKLMEWLERHPPFTSSEKAWATYDQSHTGQSVESNEPFLPLTIKQQFIYDILQQEKPATVLDCAANKGFYAEMAAKIGASVLAFDYEEFCIDECLKNTRNKRLDITPIMMDFQRPTPNTGRGLVVADAFERFQVDLVLVAGLIHHLCLKAHLPVKLFCDICCHYANKGVLLEFVELEDKHVTNWKLTNIPKDYDFEKVKAFFSQKFSVCNVISNEEDGLRRKLAYFSK